MIHSAPDVRDFFRGVDQIYHPDYDVRLPIFYYDNTALTAIYTASTVTLRKLLPAPELHPVELFPGRCLVALSAFAYRKTDIDPYNEFSITALISYGKRAIPGVTSAVAVVRNEFDAYILHLPVTSERARRGGLEMAGYPKFLADISFTSENGSTRCTVSEKGRRILTLTGAQMPTARGKLTKYRLHTRKNGIPLRANLYLNPLQYRQVRGGNAAHLDLHPGHAIADELREMQLSKQPVLYQYMPTYEAILFGSKNLMDD